MKIKQNLKAVLHVEHVAKTMNTVRHFCFVVFKDQIRIFTCPTWTLKIAQYWQRNTSSKLLLFVGNFALAPWTQFATGGRENNAWHINIAMITMLQAWNIAAFYNFMVLFWNQRNVYSIANPGQGQVITSHRYYGMWLLVLALGTWFSRLYGIYFISGNVGWCGISLEI